MLKSKKFGSSCQLELVSRFGLECHKTVITTARRENDLAAHKLQPDDRGLAIVTLSYIWTTLEWRKKVDVGNPGVQALHSAHHCAGVGMAPISRTVAGCEIDSQRC